MLKRNIVAVGIAASLCVAAVPLMASAADPDTETAVTHVRLAVLTQVACQSIGNNQTVATDIDMGELAPGENTPEGGYELTIAGSTNSSSGFTITGTPTNLVHEDGTESTGPFIQYKYGDTTPTVANWWISSTELSGVNIGATVVLTSEDTQRDFTLYTHAATKTTTPAGEYAGEISWVCVVQ